MERPSSWGTQTPIGVPERRRPGMDASALSGPSYQPAATRWSILTQLESEGASRLL